MPDEPQDHAVIGRLLTTRGRWAVVGLSRNRTRPAHGVAAYLQTLGHEVVPVHPRAEDVHGATAYPTLADVPGPLDVVDLFVNSARVGPIVDEAIRLQARAVWFQLDVCDPAAEERARAAGLDVVVGTCPAIEGRRLGLLAPPTASGDPADDGAQP